MGWFRAVHEHKLQIALNQPFKSKSRARKLGILAIILGFLVAA
ncbi:hypothetical protein UF75_4402 [Desulfosporosinus sp. I2]|nr:hypothetical protein UF75_4402 [Desulfosporosinus sp. I2]